jgi:hypothetical protein
MFERIVIGLALVGITTAEALANGVCAAPGPVLGAGLSGLVVAGVGVYAWYRNRK